MNEICTDFYELISGTNNKLSHRYLEAKATVEKDDEKSLSYLKNFISSMENIASKSKDSRISSSKGNIKDFSGYENIKFSIDYLSKNMGSVSAIKDIKSVFGTLEKFQSKYTDGYSKHIRLIQLEYESSVYMVVTALATLMNNSLNVTQSGTSIKISTKSGSTSSSTFKVLGDMAKQLNRSDHSTYLDNLLEGNDTKPIRAVEESTSYMESTVNETIDLINSIFSNIGNIFKFGKNVVKSLKNTMFGIIPLIRSALYIKYKNKADTIVALEQQVQFIQRNIDQLKKRTNIDPEKKAEIIKRQQAYIDAYKKKAEKLRAQLSDGEREASAAIAKENPEMKKTSDDDGEFVLEGVRISDIFDIFEESYKDKYPEATMSKEMESRYHAYDEFETDKLKIPSTIKLAYALGSKGMTNLYYRKGRDDINVDMLTPNMIKNSKKTIENDITSRCSDKFTKLIPVVPLASVGNGDFHVLCSGHKMMYYSHDSSAVLSKDIEEDPEKFFFIDSPNARYDSNQNKTIYIDPDNYNKKDENGKPLLEGVRVSVFLRNP